MDRIKINILSEGNSYQELILKFSGALDVMKPFLLCIQCVSANLVSEIDIYSQMLVCGHFLSVYVTKIQAGVVDFVDFSCEQE